MKRLTALLAAIALTLSLSACGGGGVRQSQQTVRGSALRMPRTVVSV